MKSLLLVTAIALSSAGCASIVKGTTQPITVNTDPQGARCEIKREGAVIAVADPTPQTVQVDKDSADLMLTCTLAGHKPGQYTLVSEAEAMAAGNVVFGGVIGLAVDAGTGALNKYAANTTVVLQPE